MKDEELKPKIKKPYAVEVLTRIGKVPACSFFLWKDLPKEIKGIYEQYKDNLTPMKENENVLTNSMFRIYLEEVK